MAVSKTKRIESKPVGRPTLYNEEIANTIINYISTTSRSLKSICDELHIWPSTIFDWLVKYPEFNDKYVCAREAQADVLADEIIEIADHSIEDHTPFTGSNVVGRDRLRVDARKWIASKLKPKKYGDKLEVDQTIREQPLFPDATNDSDK